MKQIICHNEFTIAGRISDEIKELDNNMVRVLILCPNDDDYEKLANRVYVDFNSNDYEIMKKKIGCAVAITGHIEFDDRIKLISDMYMFI